MWRAFKPTNNYFYSALYCYVPVKMRASQIDTGSTSSLSYLWPETTPTISHNCSAYLGISKEKGSRLWSLANWKWTRSTCVYQGHPHFNQYKIIQSTIKVIVNVLVYKVSCINFSKWCDWVYETYVLHLSSYPMCCSSTIEYNHGCDVLNPHFV